MAYKTPGVYVEEISTLPPSVAEVSTAIPAFIGYTKAGRTEDDKPMVARINSLLEYETLFGKANPSIFTATINADLTELVELVRDTENTDFLMYYSVSLYFKNGGGSCYIVSIGDYTEKSSGDFEDGLDELKKEDEPTLILLTDATTLDSAEYYTLCDSALSQCNELGDRFAILDVLNDLDALAGPNTNVDDILASDVEDFRNNGVSTENLKYGAAYYPYLQSSLNYSYQEDGVKLTNNWQGIFGDGENGDENGIVVSCSGKTEAPSVSIVENKDNNEVDFDASDDQLIIIKLKQAPTTTTGNEIAEAWKAWKEEEVPETQGFEITKNGKGDGEVTATDENVPLDQQTLKDIKNSNTSLYNQIKTELAEQRVILPPSPAIAGVYASVDRDRGVWKAPANVGLAAVIGPVLKITHADQENLNVDPTSGKSINAIRAFTGKGTLVWGARTLAGNDNEWRYISVRRLFIMIEESTQKATAFAVFEPNDATTWLKVKAMIESYLYGLWEQGALAGPTPEAAYFVNVGLGKTMTSQDVLEGLMNVEIGVAAVRPAEFIILKFTHKLQEA